MNCGYQEKVKTDSVY